METIKNHSSYLINAEGLIYSKLKNRPLKHHSNNGYLMVFLKNDSGAVKWQYVHRLLAIQFIPIPDKIGELWVNHKDGNKKNNSLENLEWTTIRENIQHAINTGLRKFQRGTESKRHDKPGAQKWLYALPSGESYTHYELKKLPNYALLYNRCWSNTKGHKRKLIQ
jgi:hypothetical protein